MSTLDAYSEVAGAGTVDQLRQLAKSLSGAKVVHVNSTRVGGGVAEILEKLVPLCNELGIETRWEVIDGNPEFFATTKAIHNGLQGNEVEIAPGAWDQYEETVAANARGLRAIVEDADFVFVHDPQPAPLLQHVRVDRPCWIWRCHIDASRPDRSVWRRLREYVQGYEASVFSLAAFAQSLPHPQYIIPPSIDPLSDKNVELDPSEISAVRQEFDLDPERPLLVQVSRFDRFKDPVGVIRAYRMAKRFSPALQLVLAGGSATDDPEGEEVLAEVHEAADGDSDIHVLLLPPDSHRTINALQRAATIGVQKSLREGFGLTVTESMWKGKPVIGGDCGGIGRQVVNYHTGFLVSTPEGAALRVRYLLQNPDLMETMGKTARRVVRDNFLLTRHLREYLTLMVALRSGSEGRIDLT